MDDKELEEILLDNGCENSAYFTNPNYAEAIIGITTEGCVCYSYKKIMENLMAHGMSQEKAEDFISYNIIRAVPYMGEKAPIVVYDLIVI